MFRRTLTVCSVLALTVLQAQGARADQASEAAAADLLQKRMQTQRPEDWNLLKAVEGKDIVVVQGSMDHIEQVLTAANIRHKLVTPEDVGGLDLNADQVLMVNCPGNMPDAGIKRIQKFVRAGGLLYTTDWALLNVVQKAFPRTIAHNGSSTGDHVTGVHVHKSDDNLMSNMLLAKGSSPQWWLEGGSYPIKILDAQRVTVLASSAEMGRRYGAAPVVVRFRVEDGEVVHVVSHFYRQMKTTTNKLDAKQAISAVDGLSEEQKKEFKANAPAASMGDVESSYAFQQMTSNLVVEKKKKNKELDRSYGWTPKAGASVGGRTLKNGDRVKVLERRGDKVKVRDDRGNEDEIPAAELEAR